MKANVALLLWLLFVSVYDFRQRRVPNWLVLAGAVVALAALALGMQPFGIDWTQALLGAGVGFGALLLFYAFGLMGAGDVKFAGALGLWVGLTALAPIWIVASLLAGAHGALWYVLQRWPLSPRLALILSGPTSAANGSATPRRARFIPYAAYLAMATVAWMVWGRQS
ncbi:A24 family peptidase [Variovorax sp. ZS18.2.2]|uniref:A24 family peptidase n=1 Tax=Variovorax sp. ZS18.2.2 TaxID=2971255 RepID=UPI002151981E|nr:A24 family peptidase [Variovorax sp. ZS18.2.2]MCR6479706.1 A24 family peptidase [Variovorax sp. ZS18.2.2]